MLRAGIVGYNPASIGPRIVRAFPNGVQLGAIYARSLKNEAAIRAAHGEGFPIHVVEALDFSVFPQGALDCVDFIIVLTPSGIRVQPTLAAAAAGKHVLVTKPMALTQAECITMKGACNQHGVKLGTMFPQRYRKAVKWVFKILRAGRLGKIREIRLTANLWRDMQYFLRGDWPGKIAFDRGVLGNQAPHEVDLVRLFGGGVARILKSDVAKLRHDGWVEVEDWVTADVEYVCGAKGSIRVNTVSKGVTEGGRIEIFGTTGMVVLQDNCLQYAYGEELQDAEGEFLPELLLESERATSHASSAASVTDAEFGPPVEAFAETIRGETPWMDCGGGQASVAFTNAIYAAHFDKSLNLPLVFPFGAEREKPMVSLAMV